jgi:tryptophan synthase
MSRQDFPHRRRLQISCWLWKLAAQVHNYCRQISVNTLIFTSADIIELGMPFTDPIADGPTIQKSNTQALKNGVTTTTTLQMVRDARKRGLKAPVMLMGYYNPILSYGEEKIMTDAKEAGADGFIVVDLPPEEAVKFRNWCKKAG